jgi:hypothetical protein
MQALLGRHLMQPAAASAIARPAFRVFPDLPALRNAHLLVKRRQEHRAPVRNARQKEAIVINKTAITLVAALTGGLIAQCADATAASRSPSYAKSINASDGFSAHAQAQLPQRARRSPQHCMPEFDSTGAPRGPYCFE